MLKSFNPATGALIWEEKTLTEEEIHTKILKAKKAFSLWCLTPLNERIEILNRYGIQLELFKDPLAELISQEMGKPLEESKAEVSSMIGKISISIEAYHERCREKRVILEQGNLITRYLPHGIVAVYGPFNFPGHLPNGHIVPALLAGNSVLFKPSEYTPATGAFIEKCLNLAGLPQGVFQVIQGGPKIGQILLSSREIKGIFFTGSATTGRLFQKQCLEMPEKILALEMGGNNPLILSQIDDIQTAVELTIKSAFLTTGQRCSSARRLIFTSRCRKDAFLDAFILEIKKLKIGPYTDSPFMGPLIDMKAANVLLEAQDHLLKEGAKPLLKMELLQEDKPFVTPALLDVTSLLNLPDLEYFGPFLQIIETDTLFNAIKIANATSYGLTAGLLSNAREEWEEVYSKVHAGVINWNAPLTGASSKAPFGGTGKSGNHRPSAYLAADYCSYPVASIQATLN